MKRVAALLFCTAIVIGPAGCVRPGDEVAGGAASGSRAPNAGPETLSVVVSIPPQAYFLERLGGKRVSVDVLVSPGQEPHTFEPTPRQMAALIASDVYFRIGVAFEDALVEKLAGSAPGLSVVDTCEGVKLRRVEGRHGEDENAGGRVDPHSWLDPTLVAVQAGNIVDELVRLDPDGAGAYRENLAAFRADLQQTDQDVQDALEPFKGSAILVFHPAFGYFADRYGLRQVAVETEGKEPGPKQLARIVEQARSSGARVVFVQPQFSRKSAQAIAREIGGAVVPMDPLASDYLENLRRMAQQVKQSLEPI